MEGRRFDQSCSRTFPYHPFCHLSPFRLLSEIPPPPLELSPLGFRLLLSDVCQLSGQYATSCWFNTMHSLYGIPWTDSAVYHGLTVGCSVHWGCSIPALALLYTMRRMCGIRYQALTVRYNTVHWRCGIPCTSAEIYHAQTVCYRVPCADCGVHQALSMCSNSVQWWYRAVLSMWYGIHCPSGISSSVHVVYHALSMWYYMLCPCGISCSIHVVLHALSMWYIMLYPWGISCYPCGISCSIHVVYHALFHVVYHALSMRYIMLYPWGISCSIHVVYHALSMWYIMLCSMWYFMLYPCGISCSIHVVYHALSMW